MYMKQSGVLINNININLSQITGTKDAASMAETILYSPIPRCPVPTSKRSLLHIQYCDVRDEVWKPRQMNELYCSFTSMTPIESEV